MSGAPRRTSPPPLERIDLRSDDGAFWWLTGGWSAIREHLARDTAVALVVDTCDLITGTVLQVRADGRADVHPFDRDHALRKLRRYLPGDPTAWDRTRFDLNVIASEAAFVRLLPEHLVAQDLSYDVSYRRGG